jgi:hAT family C-terminal dimerisation region
MHGGLAYVIGQQQPRYITPSSNIWSKATRGDTNSTRGTTITGAWRSTSTPFVDRTFSTPFLFLHPKYRWEYFRQRWSTKSLRVYQKPTQQAIWRLYEEQYRTQSSEKLQTRISEQEEDIFTVFMSSNTALKDKFDAYLDGPSTALLNDDNLFKWWANSGFTQLTSMVFNILSIPAMSAETERVFSDVKLTISPNRNRLEEDIIEATECLNRWYRAGI